MRRLIFSNTCVFVDVNTTLTRFVEREGFCSVFLFVFVFVVALKTRACSRVTAYRPASFRPARVSYPFEIRMQTSSRIDMRENAVRSHVFTAVLPCPATTLNWPAQFFTPYFFFVI